MKILDILKYYLIIHDINNIKIKVEHEILVFNDFFYFPKI